MPRGAFNIDEVVKQLGLKTVHELPVVEAIQPTIAVGDASALTPPLLAPSFWAGGVAGATASQRGGFQVQCLGKGGCWIREFRFSASGASGSVRFEITDAELASGDLNATIVPHQEMGPTPGLSVVGFGTSVTQIGYPDGPHWSQVSNSALPLVDGIFLGHGRYLTVQFGVVSIGFNFSVLVQEIPAVPLAPTG